MVKVWVFSGGGESEFRGLIPFLQRHFPNCDFERKMPIRPGKRTKKALRDEMSTVSTVKEKGKGGHFGKSNKSLRKQMGTVIETAFAKGDSCDFSFTLDDHDCRDLASERKAFEDLLARFSLKGIIAFAAPEIEAWLVADWNETFGKHTRFRKESHKLDPIRKGLTPSPARDFCPGALLSMLRSGREMYAKIIREYV